MQTNPYSQYQNQSIMTSTPEELTLMLYNGCLKFMSIAKTAMEEKNIQEKNDNLQKAQAIVAELEGSLDMKYDISKNLWQLYDFVMDRLVNANIKNDKQALEDARAIITDLRDTWKEAILIARTNSAPTDQTHA